MTELLQTLGRVYDRFRLEYSVLIWQTTLPDLYMQIFSKSSEDQQSSCLRSTDRSLPSHATYPCNLGASRALVIPGLVYDKAFEMPSASHPLCFCSGRPAVQ